MTKRIMCFLGLLLAGIGSVRAQDGAAPPSDLLTFVPTNDNAWITGEFLFGWAARTNLVPLVTTTIPATLDQSVAGVLGEPDTVTLLGGTQSSGLLPGFRLGGGYIYDQEYGTGVEAGFLFLSGNSSSFFFDSADHAGILARPYINATTDDQASVLVGFPGLATGTIGVESKVGDFYSFNLAMTEKIWEQESGLRLDTLFGYRFASFSDSLRIQHHIDSTTMPGESFDTQDNFSARNSFNGLDLGLRTSYSWSDRLSLSVLTKVAVGNMHRTVNIRGRTVAAVASPPAPLPQLPSAIYAAGMNALSTNVGEYRSNDLGVLPEAGANLVWKFRSNMNLRLGYSLMYLTRGARADNQIDFTLDPRLFPPEEVIPPLPASQPSRPAFQPTHSDFWIQSLNVGVDVTF